MLVEGAGGWLAPISATATMADVAEKLALPVILVVGLRLGCLNHALLTREAIRSSGLPFAGWIANKMHVGDAAGGREYRHARDAASACRHSESSRRATVPAHAEPPPAMGVEVAKKLVSP